ncbi:MAG: PRC-barrel domain-containing protein [Alkalinema sp. CAN_BIN05]|nr:PRC-barrel domain-containing protein [Alkalinema sp. CAN_BIN05]
MSEEFIRQSQLIDKIVLDRATMDECGRIEVMWCYPKVHRVLGFICKSGSFDRTKMAFNLDQLDKIGENGVLVMSAPVETDRDRVQQLESLIGCEVWTDEGKRVGRINDYVFQLKSGNIRHYLLASSGLQGLTGKLYSLYPSQILGYGRGRVMVSGGIVPGLELYQVGMDQKLEQKFSGLEERIERKLKRVADRINERLDDHGTEQSSDRLNSDASQVGQDLQAGFQSLFNRARSLGTEVSSKVKERAQDFLDEGRVQDSEWRRDRDHRANDRINDRIDDNNEFDFDDWDEQDQTQSRPKPSSEQPIAQRYSKRSMVDDNQNSSDAGSNQNEPQTDRPLLNLPIPQPSTPDEPRPDDTPRSFTAKPRPQTPDLRKSDPWDDDEWT